MMDRFPTVGVIGAGHLSRMLIAPAAALGINLIFLARSSNESAAQINNHIVGDPSDLAAVINFASKCDVVTCEDNSVPLSVIKGLEAAGIRVYPSSIQVSKSLSVQSVDNFGDVECEITVTVARSPHGQATSWTATQSVKEDGILAITITPAPEVTDEIVERAQKLALDLAAEIAVVGVMAVEFIVQGRKLQISTLVMHPNEAGNWTIDASRTGQFEQHLRAILDLPLGDPAMTHEFAVTGKVLTGDKTDMYRPYLHLMARNPDLKFHQYKNEFQSGVTTGHITAMGTHLAQLVEDVKHAREYMSGVIDE
jgi:5-(carboxyamino)imidazole ribonucleotide synthase